MKALHFISTALVVMFSSLGLLASNTSEMAALIQGRVIEKVTDAPLAYVNIGVVDKGIGTVTNSKGEFTLVIPSSLNEQTIRVSMVGYKTLEYKVSDFVAKISNDYNIFLEPDVTVIQEIAIVDSKMRSYTKGNRSKTQNFTVGFESDTLGNEFATKIKIRKRRTILKDVRLSIVENTFDTLRFRLNIYAVKNGKPGALLNKENIILETVKKDSEILIVDLLPYNVIVSRNFFVSLEWIENAILDVEEIEKEAMGLDDENAEDVEDDDKPDVSFSAQFPARTVYYRSTSHARWRSINGLGIGIEVTYLQ